MLVFLAIACLSICGPEQTMVHSLVDLFTLAEGSSNTGRQQCLKTNFEIRNLYLGRLPECPEIILCVSARDWSDLIIKSPMSLGVELRKVFASTLDNMLTSSCIEQSSAIHMQFRECHEGHKPHAGLDPTKASTGVVWTSERAC